VSRANARNVYLPVELETEFADVAKRNERSFSAELRIACRNHIAIARQRRGAVMLDIDEPPSRSNGPAGDRTIAKTADAGGRRDAEE
jgi:hypothetical protein